MYNLTPTINEKNIYIGKKSYKLNAITVAQARPIINGDYSDDTGLAQLCLSAGVEQYEHKKIKITKGNFNLLSQLTLQVLKFNCLLEQSNTDEGASNHQSNANEIDFEDTVYLLARHLKMSVRDMNSMTYIEFMNWYKMFNIHAMGMEEDYRTLCIMRSMTEIKDNNAKKIFPSLFANKKKSSSKAILDFMLKVAASNNDTTGVDVLMPLQKQLSEVNHGK